MDASCSVSLFFFFFFEESGHLLISRGSVSTSVDKTKNPRQAFPVKHHVTNSLGCVRQNMFSSIRGARLRFSSGTPREDIDMYIINGYAPTEDTSPSKKDACRDVKNIHAELPAMNQGVVESSARYEPHT